MGRFKNDASLGDVVKIMRGELHRGARPEDYMQHDIEKVVECYGKFLESLIKVCPYPTIKMLQAAAIQAWETDVESAHAFATRMLRAIVHCRMKAKSMSSGQKLHSGVKSLAALLKKRSRSFGRGSRRKLKKRKSDESQASPKKPRGQPKQPSSSSSASLSKEDILALYGLGHTAAHLPIADDLVEVFSTQRTLESPSSSDAELVASAARNADLRQESIAADATRKSWLCSADMCQKRMAADGTVEKAVMSKGPRGFALATFHGEGALETELPNLMLEAKAKAPAVMKKPAARKKPAAPQQDRDEDRQRAAESDRASPVGGSPPKAGGSPPKAGGSPPKAGGLGASPRAGDESKPANYRFEATTWGTCKAEFYQEKSYVRHLVDGTWKLVIGCNKGNHHFNLRRLVEKVKAGCTKPQLLAEREVLESPDVA